MTERHITNPRDRKTKKYRSIHDALRAYVDSIKNPDKQVRHSKEAAEYRQKGQL